MATALTITLDARWFERITNRLSDACLTEPQAERLEAMLERPERMARVEHVSSGLLVLYPSNELLDLWRDVKATGGG